MGLLRTLSRALSLAHSSTFFGRNAPFFDEFLPKNRFGRARTFLRVDHGRL